jgi:catechol 2,3-dioxygenase-like lactoylglutathione lyase family enzyme
VRILLGVVLAMFSLRAESKVHRAPVLGLAHVAWRVGDFDKASAFYQNGLGYAEPLWVSDENGKPAIALLKVNDQQYIELLRGDARSEGRLDHFALYTDDLTAIREFLLAKQVPITSDIHQGRIGNPFFAIRDPDGHPIEIVQYSPTSQTGQSRGNSMPSSRISTQISHVGILVRSETSAMKFYRDILGFREIARGGGEKGQRRWIDLQVPDGIDYIELIPFADLPSPSVMKAQNHLGLAVPDIQKAVATLQLRHQSGAELIPTTFETGENLPRRANIFDPDGARIELMEPLPAKLGGNGTPTHP